MVYRFFLQFVRMPEICLKRLSSLHHFKLVHYENFIDLKVELKQSICHGNCLSS